MKIVDTDFVKHSTGPKPSGKPGQDKADAFQKVLHETIEKSSKDHLKPSIRPIAATMPLHPARFSGRLATEANVTFERIDRFVDMLEAYQHKLTEPAASLKDMDLMLAELSLEKDRLTHVLNTLDPQDGLRDILNEALVTASREIFKFQRGDYLEKKIPHP